MIFTALIFFAVPLAVVAAYFIPPIVWLGDCRLLMVHVVFLFGALALRFQAMLVFATFSGLLWDLVELPISSAGAELRPGWSCLLFGLFGALLSGLRPMFMRGRWEVHCLASGIFVTLYLTIQFLYLTVVRGTPEFDSQVWVRIAGSGVLALFAAPIVYLILLQLVRASHYKMREEPRQAPYY